MAQTAGPGFSEILRHWAREDFQRAMGACWAAQRSGRFLDDEEVARRALMYRTPRPRDTSIVTFKDWLDSRSS